MQENGVIVLHKPSGYTSNACLQKIKHECHQKKIGHAGTLDPMVDGVLLVLLGQATKISSFLLEGGSKIYKGVIQVGYESTTWDKEGDVVAEYDITHITEEKIREEIAHWKGNIEQEVPPISAAKFKGKSLYRWARIGYDVPRKFKNVHIGTVEILSVHLPYVTFRVQCSSGTYIRSLAHSLGKRLQCGAVLYSLTREYSYPFSLDKAVKFEVLLEEKDNIAPYVKPITEALPHFSSFEITEEQYQMLRYGRALSVLDTHTIAHTRGIAVYEGKAVALLEYVSTKEEWKILRGLF